MSYWNYRVLKHKLNYGIHEVYYDKNDKPKSCTLEPIIIGDSINKLLDELELLKKSIDKPVLSFLDLKQVE